MFGTPRADRNRSRGTRGSTRDQHERAVELRRRRTRSRKRRPVRRMASVQQHRSVSRWRLLGDATASAAPERRGRARRAPAPRSSTPATRRAATSVRPPRRARSASRTPLPCSATSACTRCSTTRAAIHLQPEGAQPLSGGERQLRAGERPARALPGQTAADTVLFKELAVYRNAPPITRSGSSRRTS